MRVVINKALPLVKEFEGFSAKPYICAGGENTIGYGTLVKDLPKGMETPITKAQAEKLLADRLLKDWQSIRPLVDVPLEINQAAAILSFVYNLGIGNFKKSTLLRRLNAGLYDEAAAEFLKWNKAGGKTLKGLTRRRNAEKALFETPSASIEVAAVKTSRSVKGAVASGAAGTAAVAGEVINNISPAIPLAQQLLDVAPYLVLGAIIIGASYWIIKSRIDDAKGRIR